MENPAEKSDIEIRGASLDQALHMHCGRCSSRDEVIKTAQAFYDFVTTKQFEIKIQNVDSNLITREPVEGDA